MERTHMVHLATVRSGFHARVIAARLGADGILTELRGAVDGPYPMGDVHVFVGSDELSEATELLMVDDVESAFDAGAEAEAEGCRAGRRISLGQLAFLLASGVALAVTIFARIL